MENNYIASGGTTFLVKENGFLNSYTKYYNNDEIYIKTKIENSVAYVVKIDETYNVYEKVEIEKGFAKGDITITESDKNNFMIEFKSDNLEESSNVNNFNLLVHDIFGDVWTLKFKILVINSETANLLPVADFMLVEYSNTNMNKYYKITDKSYDKDADISGHIVEWKITVRDSDKNIFNGNPYIFTSKDDMERDFIFNPNISGTYTIELQLKDNDSYYNEIIKKETVNIISATL